MLMLTFDDAILLENTWEGDTAKNDSTVQESGEFIIEEFTSSIALYFFQL